ncbi:transcriptional regulator PpsR [Variovorax sp. J22R133]|uniref:transcriptional regulator PpsR n=1 Tax=Variovorax brevis TaxID=3053503 RepID=UPI0025786B19|nr:transcriptional regulator PpsR [Variovorax sp. J22R133]MDM0113817.1 transcriptional regulator PpsR [Variovorax sp. J22R133]
MKSFAAPAKHLNDLDAGTVGQLIAAAADLVLVLDADGVIRDLALGNTGLDGEGFEEWIGKSWLQTVGKESRAKAEAVLGNAEAGGAFEWKQLTHRTEQGKDMPLACAAIKLRDTARYRTVGRTVVFSRDLRGMTALQQSVVDAQQESLHDQWKVRDAQSRYRQLFQNVSDAVLVIDAATQKIVEANPASVQLFGDNVRKLVGATFPTGLDARSTSAVQSMLVALRSAGRADDIRAHVADGGGEVMVSGSVFRQENGMLLVVRLWRVATGMAAGVAAPDRASANAVLLKLVQGAPDGVVVTDINGQIVSANNAFVEMVQLANDEQVRGESLGRWVGRTGVELSVLISTLRQRESLRLFPTSLRSEHGMVTDVEISAALARDGDQPYLGFTIRDVSRRPSTDMRAAKELPRSASQLSELVGRVPMKDIVGETTDLIEQLCIEAALDLTRDNRAAAAEMLGMSRQSLYVKLRRYGLGELAPEIEKQ